MYTSSFKTKRYWVLPVTKLQPVTLEIQHCALKNEATIPNLKFNVMTKMWESFCFATTICHPHKFTRVDGVLTSGE